MEWRLRWLWPVVIVAYVLGVLSSFVLAFRG